MIWGDILRSCDLGPTREALKTEAPLEVFTAKLFQTRAVTGWDDGEEDGRPGRRSPTLNSHHVAFVGGTDQPR